MNKLGFLVAPLFFVALACAAQASPPLVNPVSVAIGATVHVTPVDQNSAAIMPSNGSCTISSIPVGVATVTYDGTGVLITGVAPGSQLGAVITCKQPAPGITTVASSPFTVTVLSPPWGVTAVGTSSP